MQGVPDKTQPFGMTSSRPGNRPKMDLDLPVLTMPSSSIGTLAKTLSARMGRRILPMIAMAAVLAMTAVHAGAARVNFAKYQAVTASGQFSTYGPDFAVEGIASNFHSFRTNNTSNPQWLEVRFPRAVMIGSAHLYLGLDNVNDPTKDGLAEFKLQYHDGSNWLDIPGALVTGM